MNSREPCRPLDLLGRELAQVPDVLGDRRVNQLRCLRDVRNEAVPILWAVVLRRSAVHEVTSLSRRPELEQQLRDGGLAGTRGAGDTDRLAGVDRERHMLERRSLTVRIGDVFEGDRFDRRKRRRTA